MPNPTITLALGGGGIGGIGHIPVLQGLDDLNIRPTAISGVSAGAIVGACYASGMSGDAIHDHVMALEEQWTLPFRALFPGSLITGRDARRVIDNIIPETVPETFAELPIPLTIGTTDVDARKPIYFSEGILRPVIAASMTIPGLFRPVKHQGRRLIDGGVLDNFALGTLPNSDLKMAVDAASQPQDMEVPERGIGAGIFAMRMMMEAMAEANFAHHKPDIVIRARKIPISPADFLDPANLLEALAPLREETVRVVSKALTQHAQANP